MNRYGIVTLGLLFIAVFLPILYGCSPLRKYGSSDNGFVGVLFINQFGKGNRVHDYFINRSNEIINIGDSYKRVITILGEPDKDTRTVGGYRVLTYKDNNVIFYLDGPVIKYIYGYKGFRQK